jgi:ribosome-interacting GTPase 1
MPANLTPEYRKAEQEYKAASRPDERLACLQRMLSVMPKHKGTDKLQGDIKRRIALLKKGQQERGRKKGPSYRVRPEGAGQIMLVGPPNSGKSTLLAALTHAEPHIADYPCTTLEPMPGMARWKDIQFQLVDLPPVWRGHSESFVFDNIRGGDGTVVLVDVSAPDPVGDIQETLAILGEKHLEPVPPRRDEESDDPGLDDTECLLVLNKADLDPDGGVVSLIREMMDTPLPVTVISAKTGAGLDALSEAMFRLLHMMRIYTKEPGKPADRDEPYAVPAGSTVLEFAERVHKDFAEQFKSARVWGSAKFDGQTVQRDHVLQDGDVVELAR